MEQGYVYKDGTGTFSYVYQYKDHLENVRLSYTDVNRNGTITNSEIREENHYYAFGLQHKGYNAVVNSIGNAKAQNWKYNGIEMEKALGYDMYEMHFRQYDPAIARWVVIDPVIHYNASPYTGFNNNPVYFLDPSGAAGMSHSLRLQDFDGNWHTVGADGISAHLDMATGEITNGQGEIIDPYAPPLEEHDNLSTGGRGGGGDPWRKALRKGIAKRLAVQYKFNENQQMAYSIMMAVLFETTEAGELLTEAREKITEIYGTEQAKEASEVYSNVLDIVKDIKESVGGKYMSDTFIYTTSGILGAKALALDFENHILASRIKLLDVDVYNDYNIGPIERNGGGFGGGGAGSSW